MNVVAGIVIGFISKSWIGASQYSLIWSIIHVAYGYIFGLHINEVTVATKKGNPILSYFIARFFTALITSIIFASVTFFIISLFDG